MSKKKARELGPAPVFVPGILYDSRQLAAGLHRPSLGALHVARHKRHIKIAVIRCGGKLLFRGEDILAYIDANRDESGSTKRPRTGLPSGGRPRGKKVA